MKQFDQKDFTTTPAEFAGAPFWAWNDTITIKGIDEKLQMLHENGFGGAFVHPRPGLTNEYLSKEWFMLWEHALYTAKRLGMKLYIYDENTYPTGYAGGEIAANLPDCAARSAKVFCLESYAAVCALLEDPALSPDTKTPLRLFTAAYQQGGLCLLQRVEEWQQPQVRAHKGPFVAVLWQQPYASAWFGGFPNPDLLRPEVTQALLQTTYEAYYRHFGMSFGTDIPAVFSDEPGISPGSVQIEDALAFPFSRYFAAQFYRRCGYCFEDVMACIALDIPKLPCGRTDKEVRYDYYCTLRALWEENFVQPVSAWCSQHGIAWTGHFLDEHWPYPWGCCSPAVMSMYEFMHWPGIDMLMSHLLRDAPQTPLMLPLKELSSVGNQLGKERLLCECYGAGGWDATIADFKRIGDWLAVNGITFFNQHLTLHSLAGARKYGHPQSFDDTEPWWREYGELNAYFGRISYAMSCGRPASKVLVLHPTTSWFLQCPSQATGDLLWHFEAMPTAVQTYIGLLQEMQRRQIPFDLGDEFLMERHAKVENGHLFVGQCAYEAVLLLPQMENIRSQTLHLLLKALDVGVEVLHMGVLPHYLDGRPHDLVLKGAKEVRHPVEYFAQQGFAELEVIEDCPGLALQKRVLENGCIYFIANSSKLTARFVLKAESGTLVEMDAFTGRETALQPIEVCKNDGSARYDLMLRQNAALLLRFTHGDSVQTVKKQPAAMKSHQVQAVLQRVRALQENVLPLNYCTLMLRGRAYENIYVLAACDKVYHAYGFEQNPWDMAVQFRQRNLQRPVVGREEGFCTFFDFQLDEKMPQGTLRFAGERPSLCRLSVNGVPCAWLTGEKWLDPCMGVADITGAVHPGKNTAALEYLSFDVNAEIQPVYLLGDFCVKQADDAFMLSLHDPLGEGALCGQGYPFYSGRVEYEYSLWLEKKPEQAYLSVPRYEASALSVLVNGVYVGQLGIGEGNVLEITAHVKSGNNTILLELSCSLKNLLGPHHTAQPVRGSAWPAAWRQAPIYGQPSAQNYDVLPYGVLQTPMVLLSDYPV